MKRLSSLAFVFALPVIGLFAQTSDLVFFADDGAKFTLLIDGDRKNMEPASRVVATGIRTESPVVVISFEDGNIPELRKPGYFPLGKEYTIMITTNKKGQKVLRPTGEAALGATGSAEPSKLVPTDFVSDDAKPASTSGTTSTGSNSVQTTTTVQETGADGDNVNMNVGIDMNGMGVDMNVNVTEGTRGTTSSASTTTTTTTTSTSTNGPRTAKPTTTAVPEPVSEPVYNMPGYTGAVGCPWPMNDSEFGSMKGSIESKTFEESKMTMAKQMLKDRCLKVSQVKGIMGLFTFEDSKLDFAKYAYDRTYDIGNYYQVNDLFTFEASIDELNQYLESK